METFPQILLPVVLIQEYRPHGFWPPLKILKLSLYLKTIQGLIKQLIDQSLCYQ